MSEDSKIYRKEMKIVSSDVDAARRLRPGALFTMFAEAAIAHTTELGAGRERTLDRGYLWVVAFQRVFISRMPVYDERVTLLSWPGRRMRTLFPRYTRILDSSGNVLVNASAIWTLLDENERTVVDPEEIHVDVPGTVFGGEAAFPCSPKVSREGEEDIFTVPYSFVDINGHMNNARYPDLAWDRMTGDFRGRPVREIQTEYAGEIGMNQKIRLVSRTEGDVFTLLGTDEPGEKVLFKIRVEAEA